MRRLKGFTLIELLVVVAIIGILATVIVVNLTSSQNKARDAKLQSDLEQIANAAEIYKTNNSGSLPTTGWNVTALTTLTDTILANLTDGTATARLVSKLPEETNAIKFISDSTTAPVKYIIQSQMNVDTAKYYECYTGKVCDDDGVAAPTAAK